MAPKLKKKDSDSVSDGMFKGMVIHLVETGIQTRRLQVWKHKLVQMGAIIEDHLSRRVSHIFATSLHDLLLKIDRGRMISFKGSALHYKWLEDSLKQGERVSEDPYKLEKECDGVKSPCQSSDTNLCESHRRENSSKDVLLESKRAKVDAYLERRHETGKDKSEDNVTSPSTGNDSPESFSTSFTSLSGISQMTGVQNNNESTLLYDAPDLNRNITEIFGKLINIYRALGDDRRSFSYYKAIPVIEKLPFKIESVNQVKDLPAIGKSMQEHIHEIVTTGKLSKLEHFENDEKVRIVALFGEVWGIGPATALKLYEKGYRTLSDLEMEDSLTSAQRIGLKYFDDIKKRIPRCEVKDTEALLQRVGEEILPGVLVVCGGSYRRGKATCGDMDIVITHPDGKSHRGFLTRYVENLKSIKFLREDLLFSTHSMEGTDSGVDTYFGLCTYPGKETRHRIDFKVYPRDIYAFGLIAWTGNDVLNRRLRLLAESKGYRLDDTGLFLAMQGSGGKKGMKCTANVRWKTEREVFEFLGFPWLEPHERNL
ncbi:hypothetical protein H6P81_009560 [Aristolochia fimbriata]|uniref:DNA polymerase n=1 Tax=Aristolochia fimbriata TaxID=158543 RepID=A0AAV7EL90_ARIFI|nr:hypothetical protein H6P81_009560 [Aristolochia fimbriata]